jgi:acyl carrier protein
MRMSDTLARLNEVFRDVFGDDELSVTRETTAHQVEGWDSLMHVTLIIAVERAFSLRLSSSEVASLESVGDLLELIESKQART